MDEGTLVWLVTLGVFTLFMIGVPIFLVIGFWIVGVSVAIDFTLANLGATLFEGLNFFGLLALPLFILTGDLINAGGIAKRLSDFAYSVLGWIRGGMAMATLGACGMFAAISGSNAATAATIGSIMHPEMKENGYDPRFSASTIAAGGVVGIIIPPSIIFIVYGFLMNIPITDLFIAGMLPGVLLVAVMMVTCFIMSYVNSWGTIIRLEGKRVVRTGLRAYLGFLAMFIVLYGIYSGAFSPTEAAAMTVGFCLLAGLLITREIKITKLPDVLMRSGQVTGILAPLIAVSIVMQQLLSILGAQQLLVSFLLLLGDYYLILLACMALILIFGTVLESLPLTIILAPILAPIAHAMGIDPVHFAVIFLVGGAIGFITPPYGLNLYVASAITGIPYFRLLKYIVPYIFALLCAWVVIVLYAPLSTYLVQFGGN